MSVYLVSVCEITNMNENLKTYAQQSAELISKFGGEYIVRGPVIKNLEGSLLPGKSVIVTRFQDEDSINTFFNSEEYQALKPMREGTGIYDIGIFNGVE